MRWKKMDKTFSLNIGDESQSTFGIGYGDGFGYGSEDVIEEVLYER